VTFAGINYLAVLVAAAAGYAFGALWYTLLGQRWMAALGKTKDQFSPSKAPFVYAAVCQLLIAYMLAGVLGHLGGITLIKSLIAAGFLWFGFVLATMVVNHRFQGSSWSLTAIDAGHWLGVLLIMGLVLGLFGI